MRRLLSVTILAATVGCGPRSAAGGVAAPPSHEQLAAELVVARQGCTRCHAAAGPAAERLAPRPGPALAQSAAWLRDDGGESMLRRHHGGAAAADLAAFVASSATTAPTTTAVPVAAAVIARGERRLGELACGACHAPTAFAGLSARVDASTLAAFLSAPDEHRPGLAHPAVDAAAATELAAWLLREQLRTEPKLPGFAWSCFERRIDTEGQPELGAAVPVAAGRAMKIDASHGTRDHHFVLRWTAVLDVPADGAWTFTTGSDDSSWLWIDDQLVVRNEGLAPHRRAEGAVTLTAGPHALRVDYTQAGGGASLEVLWRGPGVDEAPVPGERASSSADALVPPPARPAPAADAVERGRRAARERRCDACHTIDDQAFAALPAPAPAMPLARLGNAECPQVPGAAAIATAVQPQLAAPSTPAVALFQAMEADGCLRCHSRDGRGGLPPPVRERLAEVEDLGDEGKLPPDLSGAGARLRPQWIEQVLTGAKRARPYLRAAMPKLAPERAKAYAAWFAAVDATPAAMAEPPFTVAAAARGRELAGTSGKNCITCHGFQGARALGPQGMDLGLQYERTQPGWFRDWLLLPHQLRPGTRMPTLWPVVDEPARADADALRTWLSLGAAAPLPNGLPVPGALVLQPTTGPRLHGAFLQGVSARCLCVGTPERTHFAYDLAAPALVWLWRGDYVDASGTWSGRAGELLLPKGVDHVTLREPELGDGRSRSLRGQRRDADGYPVLVVAAGDAVYEDSARPRLSAAGSEVVRTLRCVDGSLEFVFPTVPGVEALVDGAKAARHALTAGQRLEVVYRW
jgi:hypothetical protein